MGKFSSDDHYVYYCGQESLRRNGVALIVNKRDWNAVLGYSLKNDRMILVHFQGKSIQYNSNPSLCPNHWCWRSLSWPVLWRPIRPSRTNTKKRCPFHHRGLECKRRKSRDTGNNRQVWPWNTKYSRAEANSFVKRTHQSWKTPISNNTRDDSTHGHHQMVNTKIRLIIFFADEYYILWDGEALYSQQKQDQELSVAQIMNSLLPNSDLNWRK